MDGSWDYCFTEATFKNVHATLVFPAILMCCVREGVSVLTTAKFSHLSASAHSSETLRDSDSVGQWRLRKLLQKWEGKYTKYGSSIMTGNNKERPKWQKISISGHSIRCHPSEDGFRGFRARFRSRFLPRVVSGRFFHFQSPLAGSLRT